MTDVHTTARLRSYKLAPATKEDLLELYRELMELPASEDRAYYGYWAQTMLGGMPLSPMSPAKKPSDGWIGNTTHVILRRTWRQLGAERSEPVALLAGYRTRLQANGAMQLGGPENCVFAYSFGFRPFAGAKGKILDLDRSDAFNAGLVLQSALREAIQPRPDGRTAEALHTLTLPKFWAVYRDDQAPPVTAHPGAIATALDALCRPERYSLPMLCAPAGGRILEVTRTDRGTTIQMRLHGGDIIDMVLPPTALLEVGVEEGLNFREGSRLAYLVTPRTYPSWSKVEELIGPDWAFRLLQESVRCCDWKAGGQVRRLVAHCTPADLARAEIVLEDNSELFSGTVPIARVMPNQVPRKQHLAGNRRVDLASVPFRWATNLGG